MKIAIPTDDGTTISAHFGKATHYLVVTLVEGRETARELRQRTGGGQIHLHEPGHEHQLSHDGKFGLVQDCDMLIGGGMGHPAMERLQGMGLQVVLSDHKQIDSLLAEAAQGIFTHNPKRAHQSHHQH